MEKSASEYEAEIERLKEANAGQLEFHKMQTKAMTDELEAVRHDYKTLKDATLVLGKPAAIINHLEKQLRIRDFVIDAYQKHYAKWGRFYQEYEEKHEKSPKRG